MKSGARPNKLRHFTKDYLKSFHPGLYEGTAPYPTFPTEYLTDTASWMPNQDTEGLPSGCTDYATAALAILLGQAATPEEIENVTHANANGGYSIQGALQAAVSVLKWFTAYYQIRETGPLDYFDAFRLAQSSGIPEKRAISFGCPWFPSWEAACKGQTLSIDANGVFSYTVNPNGPQAIMPMPLPQEIQTAMDGSVDIPWHDSELDGWSPTFFPSSNGVVVYRDKSWQGTGVGQGGFVGFTREVINTVMAIKGTAGFTASDAPVDAQYLDLNWAQTFMSYIATWLGFAY